MRSSDLRRLTAFGLIAFFLSWSYWLVVIASLRGWIAMAVPLTPFGALGPAMAALLVSIATGGRQGAAGLLRRLGPQGATWRTVAIAFVSWPLLVGGALAVTAVRDSALGSASAFSWRILPLAFVEVLLFTSIGEELGWRGFGLPVLLRRTRPAVATLAVGGIWAAWHLPLFWIPNTVQASIPLP